MARVRSSRPVSGPARALVPQRRAAEHARPRGNNGAILPDNWLPLAPGGVSLGPAPTSLLDRHDLLNHTFADAWRVTNTTTLFDYSPGTTTDTFTDRAWPPPPGEPCVARLGTQRPAKGMALEIAQQLCRQIKEDQAVYENCVLDLQATGEVGFLKAYLQTLNLREETIAAGGGGLQRPESETGRDNRSGDFETGATIGQAIPI